MKSKIVEVLLRFQMPFGNNGAVFKEDYDRVADEIIKLIEKEKAPETQG